jgi:23S rRNA pseudouridine1911/1915/1917 synthase
MTPFDDELEQSPYEAELDEQDDEEVEGTESDLFEHYRYNVDKGQESMRIDLFIMIRMEKATRNKVQNAIKDGFIKVNGQAVKSNYKIKPKDIITVEWTKPRAEYELIPEDLPLEIVHEDEHVMIVNKAAGMVAHPSYGHYTGTLANALAYKFQQMPLLDKEHPDRPGLVHRIDKNTTGLLVVAKTDVAMQALAKQFFDHSINRRYVALVWGDLPEEEGTIRGNITRHPTLRKIRTVTDNPNEGKHAVTHYTVLKRYGYVTLVECRLETGRTHQIRVHFKHIGHPLFNDFEYGGERIAYGTVFTKYKEFIFNCFEVMPYHALHARLLGFVHPGTGEYTEFHAPLPDNFNELISRWERYTAARNI